MSRSTKAVSDVAVAALSCRGGCNVVGPVLEALRRAVGADVAGYYQHEWTGWTTALYITPAAFWARVPNAHVPTHAAAALHPGIRLCVEHPTGLRPFTLTDLMSERDWLASEMGTLMRPDWGRNYQLAIPVTTPGARESRVWVLGRADRDFTPGDRDVAVAARDVLDVVSRHAQCREEQRRSTVQQPIDPLTERELLILQLLEDGLTAQGAAAQLGISTRTVQKHTEHIYRKLGAHDRHTALQAAAELTRFVD